MRASYYTHLLHVIGIAEKRAMSCVDLSEGPKKKYIF